MRTWFVVLLGALLVTCQAPHETLPILGNREVVPAEGGGEQKMDTVYHAIDLFSFTDQDGNAVSNATYDGKIYVADFFFTSCPSICPIMKTQMLRVYNEFLDDPEVMFLSHSIDPEFDTVEVLHDYANRLGVATGKWHFVTGDREEIYRIAQVSYMSVAAVDEDAPGGYIHSGRFLLVDGQRHIRGAYDGTDPEDVDRLIADIAILQLEQK